MSEILNFVGFFGADKLC